MQPFAGFGYFPLRYSTNLKHTVFKSDYYREMILTYMDNLNLLYVAFTRAEDGLFAFGQLPPKSRNTGGKINHVANLVHRLLADSDLMAEDDQGDELVFRLGSASEINDSKKEESQIHSVTLQQYHSNNWHDKLAVRQRAASFFTEAFEERRSKINYGLLVHELLARIKHKDHLERALDELQQEGAIDQSDREMLHRRISGLFQMPVVNSWFSTDWEVKTEVPILPKTGEIGRPDRVMIADRQAIIVDFKTGEPKSRDRQQVMEYLDLLREMGFTAVSGYLLYIEKQEVEQVV